jgi:hypothetical protein
MDMTMLIVDFRIAKAHKPENTIELCYNECRESEYFWNLLLLDITIIYDTRESKTPRVL